MNDLIILKGGIGEVPELQDKEIAYRRDEKALYIGTPEGNVRLTGAIVATYGETTGEEIHEAYRTGKMVYCKIPSGEYGGRILMLSKDWQTGQKFTFTCFEYPVWIAAEVDGSLWSITTNTVGTG